MLLLVALFLFVMVFVAAWSIIATVRDVRALHRTKRNIVDGDGGAGGVSAAGMTFIGNSMLH
ncbi:MAG: hypothetical protein ACTHMS_13645 [Jatrophihabitans sp.]|uniref:hypothetical protein n=1 Tax=Jatrophihabitans sp. TaxID=1932789 RepID=UPI003F7FFEB1